MEPKRVRKSKSWRNLAVDGSETIINPTQLSRTKTGYTPPKKPSNNDAIAARKKRAVRAALLLKKKNKSNTTATTIPSITTATRRAKTTDVLSTSSQSLSSKLFQTSINTISPPHTARRPATALGPRQIPTTASTSASSASATWNMKSVLYRQPGNSSILTTSRRIDPLLRIMTRHEEQHEDLSDSLLVAAENGDAKTVDSLLRQGASADARGTKGLEQFTALHYAACRGHLLVAERLIRAGGANVHAINKDGESPLHLAAYGGYLNIVELLLDSKANVHATNGYQETPLFYAARRGYGAVTRLLMRRGADPDHTSRFGDTAIDDCADGRVKQIIIQWNASNLNSDSDSNSSLVGFSTGLLGKLSTRILKYVCSMMDVSGLGLIAQIDGRCHRVVESQDLWAALGVSRWELAVRASVKEAAGGFEMEPILANFRPSGSRPTSKESSRSKSSNRSDENGTDDEVSLLMDVDDGIGNGTTVNKEVPESSGGLLGLSMDVFLD